MLLTTDCGKEIWELYENGELHPAVELTGRFERMLKAADVVGVMEEIDAARREAEARLRYQQEG